MSTLYPLSVLDLAPITQGSTAAESFQNSVSLAQQADQAHFTRYWLAEHHGMVGIASAATSVLIAHLANHTQRIRVGAGGIMLPNHSPLVIAEQFGTLEALFPKRIDLGLGRAPGSDQRTAQALRRNLSSDPNEFPRDVLELLDYLSDQPEQPIPAVPGRGSNVPVWILGSSLFGAQLAAMLGLPYAFASHFAPAQMMDAIAVYRTHFKPSSYLQKPYVMLGFNVFAAETDNKAQYLASSWQQSFVSLRQDRPIQLPPPVVNYIERSGPLGQAVMDHALNCAAIGSLDTIIEQTQAFIDKTGADELMITSNMYDHAARLESYALIAQAHPHLKPATPTV
ncbi:luciferase family oxidoreductase group 1 [Paenalcaligenes hominis]|uniref:Luciferase family oxidoreductase group 1 n=1 Tax=Paenalcaligenes hominis TaxID=643674 RepID=A0ABX0WN02_9BURK|nr:LLM class flavin-dependent oxidoreductase [Paenalcaligenes hominis]NJB64631.1 luciferase family oxidoreductase group 1 [Paenalcaligenes hominis]GGE60233.1 alkane 1-monooxygenase [Paenalcaligenes hominis]